jgi:hypothetical protein
VTKQAQNTIRVCNASMQTMLVVAGVLVTAEYLDALLLEAHDRLLLSSQLVIVLCMPRTLP